MKKTANSEKIELNRHLLGTMPDAKIAKLLGVSTSHVGNVRRLLGIPSFKKSFFKKKTKCECGEKATNRFQGKNVCDACLTSGYELKRLEDFVYSGQSCLTVD